MTEDVWKGLITRVTVTFLWYKSTSSIRLAGEVAFDAIAARLGGASLVVRTTAAGALATCLKGCWC